MDDNNHIYNNDIYNSYYEKFPGAAYKFLNF